MLLLGFGLVHIPRAMLREADPASRLRYAHYKCALLCLQKLVREQCLVLTMLICFVILCARQFIH